MTTDSSRPPSTSAEVHVLTDGYADMSPTPWSVASTVTYVRDGDTHLIVDPGLVRGRSSILDPLRDLGVAPEDITDIVFSHHHPDHTVNAALFPRARMHDHMAIYRDDTWLSRPAEGFEISGSIRLIETPGHTPQDITTLVDTAEGTVALTHLWWFQAGPPEDPLATDGAALRAGRERVLDIATLIIPGHGASFVPDASTPR
ncbi:MBL fold metallo-hydrolase [Blastococcus saxobsidens]|uniref:Metallo-beta-lactamase domain-containing protein 1 n=1 Tax=Blastococcus saxobsidens (strain DD2) TaxID=1146883 RepID=H6RMD7_BLASD|nr:MBL fold metallo-hydrolase [Blastococcus saxobsidens]CCG02573.1 putative metallo-beta-lactamase [Blastococcus saxobsidens DD2]